MKIIHIVSGAGGMYCGSCLHAGALTTAVAREGAEILMVPAYTPIRTDQPSPVVNHMLYGGLNVYLQQKSGLFRYLPAVIQNWLDSPALVGMLSRMSSSVRPERLGSLTVSMLQGEEGRLRAELDKVIRWLADEIQPDLVHLSNVMLVGMARRIRQQLDVPVVCSLTGEDAFLDALREPWHARARQTLRERCTDLAALIAMNPYYAAHMTDYLDLQPGQVRVIQPGLDLSGYEPIYLKATGVSSVDVAVREHDMPTIGFLSRICPEKGLHHLVDAWLLLDEDPDLPKTRLRVAGHLAAGDRRYLKRLRQQIARRGLANRFDCAGELTRTEKIEYLRSLDVMCLPSQIGESKALPVLESLAAATPVVLPDRGAFPDILEETGGGLLYIADETGSIDQLAGTLRRLLLAPELAARLAVQGNKAVFERFNDQLMAERTVRLYRNLLFKAEMDHGPEE